MKLSAKWRHADADVLVRHRDVILREGKIPEIQQCLVPEGSHVFLDVKSLLGAANKNQTEKLVRVVGYMVDNKEYHLKNELAEMAGEVDQLDSESIADSSGGPQAYASP